MQINVNMFIIDEISMVSSLNLAYIHLRLEELFGSDDWFGSRNILFVGDVLQLQPVNGNHDFKLIHKLGRTGCVNICDQICKNLRAARNYIYRRFIISGHKIAKSVFLQIWMN